ncbi:MAG: FkbM family methyltransferase [Gemmatimonadetes bacterium]|nr:FkbM family methyltransferase [Gemmatimonadota bacterium]
MTAVREATAHPPVVRELDAGAPEIAGAWKWHRFHPRWIPDRLVARLAERALRAWAEPVVVRLPAGFRMRLDLRDDIQCTIAHNGDWEGEIFDACAARVRPGDTVLDVGAHTGYATLRFAQWVGDRGRVVALEPLPGHVAAIRRNLELNGWLARATIVEAAAGDHTGGGRFIAGSGLNLGVGALATATPDGTAGEPLTVATVALDDWLEAGAITRVALCKIDIEGAEGLALRGLARACAARRIAALLVEVHPATLPAFGDSVPGIASWCEAHGYRISWWNNAGAFVAPPAPAGATYLLAVAPEGAR